MKTKNFKLFVLLMLLTSYCTSGYAGGIKTKSGSLSALKSEKSLRVQFDYSELKVRSEKMDNEPEADYVSRTAIEYNETKTGKGDSWKQEWITNRAIKYHPAFIKQFNKETEKVITVSDSCDCKYTLVVKAQLINPGMYSAVTTRDDYSASQRAYILVEYSIVESIDHSKIICEMEPILAIEKVEALHTHGYEVSHDMGDRITDVFEYGGKELGKFFDKNLK